MSKSDRGLTRRSLEERLTEKRRKQRKPGNMSNFNLSANFFEARIEPRHSHTKLHEVKQSAAHRHLTEEGGNSPDP